MAAVQNLYRQRRLWKANDDLHFLLFYDNVWSTFWLVSLLRVYPNLEDFACNRISKCNRLHFSLVVRP